MACASRGQASPNLSGGVWIRRLLGGRLHRSGGSWGGGSGGYDSGGSYDYSNSCGTSYDSRGSRTLGVIGLTRDQRLVCFNEFSPGGTSNIGSVRGFTGGDSALIGIDYRVQDRRLYGVGNAGGVYTIDSTNGNMTFVNRLTVALDGTKFGVDFNPVADRLRVISENGQNLRHNVNAGGVTVVDGTLNYVAGTAALGVTGAGYTNNDLDPNTATTLYDVDSNLDQVALQVPPNAGRSPLPASSQSILAATSASISTARSAME